MEIHPKYAEKNSVNGLALMSNSSPHDDFMKKPHFKDERHGLPNRKAVEKNFNNNATPFQDSGRWKNFGNQTYSGNCSVNENRSADEKFKNNVTNSTK